MINITEILKNYKFIISLLIACLALFYLIKTGISKVILFIIDNVKMLFDFGITEFKKVFDLIKQSANEIQMLSGGVYFYQHPPINDIQYVTVACYFAINTIVLLKKGDINIDKIVDSIKDVASFKKDEDKKE